ncbi:MAG: hypothetical protein ACR2IK_04315 [Chloroflexota bacterium]
MTDGSTADGRAPLDVETASLARHVHTGWAQAHARVGPHYPLISVRFSLRHVAATDAAQSQRPVSDATQVARYALALAKALAEDGKPPRWVEVDAIQHQPGTEPLVVLQVAVDAPGVDPVTLARLSSRVLGERKARGDLPLNAEISLQPVLAEDAGATALPSQPRASAGMRWPQALRLPKFRVQPGFRFQAPRLHLGFRVPRPAFRLRQKPRLTLHFRLPRLGSGSRGRPPRGVPSPRPPRLRLARRQFSLRVPRLRWLRWGAPRLGIRVPRASTARAARWPGWLRLPRATAPALRSEAGTADPRSASLPDAVSQPAMVADSTRAGRTRIRRRRAPRAWTAVQAVVVAVGVAVFAIGVWYASVTEPTDPGGVSGTRDQPVPTLQARPVAAERPTVQAAPVAVTVAQAALPVATAELQTSVEPISATSGVPSDTASPGAPGVADSVVSAVALTPSVPSAEGQARPTIAAANAAAAAVELPPPAVASVTPVAAGATLRPADPPSGATASAVPVGATPQPGPPELAGSNVPSVAGVSVVGTSPPAPTAQPSPAGGGGRVLIDVVPRPGLTGWPSDPSSTAWLAEDGYHVFARQSQRFAAVGLLPTEQQLRDVQVSATFHKTGGPDGGGYGIIVRDLGPPPRDGLNQGGRYYVLEVGDLGQVGIWRREQDRWDEILGWTASAAVRPGAADNNLSVRTSGEQLTLSVNGTQVATQTDTVLQRGSVGVFVGGDQNHAVLTQFRIESND